MVASKNLEKSLVERIRAVQRSTQANKRCADCMEMGPTYICLDFKTFVCQTCSGLHREFGHKIKGISLSEWTILEVQDIECGGNELAAQCWLASWKTGDAECAQPDNGDPESLREFMRKKYVEKRWWKEPQEKVAAATAVTSTTADAKVAADDKPLPLKIKSQACDLLGDFDAGAQCELEKEVTTGMFDPNGAVNAGSSEIGMIALAPSTIMPAPAPSSTITTAPIPWAADFGESPAKASEQRSPAPVGLMDLEFPVAEAPTESKSQDGGLSGVNFNTEVPSVTSAPTAGPEATTGDRLREALLSGSGSELNSLLASTAAPPAPEPELSVAERFEALQGNLQNLFSTSSGGPLPTQSSLPQATAATPSACSLPGITAGTIGTSASGPAPQPTQQLSGLSRQQLVQMQAMIVHALHEQEQTVQVQAAAPETFLEDIPNKLPEKEREFGDLLAMFNEKHPISGLL